MANLELCGSWVPEADSVELIVSVTVTIYLTKIENRTKNL